MTNLTKQLQDLLYPYAPNKLSKIEMDTKIIPAIEDLLAEEVEVMYQKGLRDSATDTCSITGCTEKATTGINNQDYCDKHFEEQRKAVELKLKELTGKDYMNDRPIDLDTVFQVKLDDKQQGYLWANLSPKSKKLITQWADQRAISKLPKRVAHVDGNLLKAEGWNAAIDASIKAFGGKK